LAVAAALVGLASINSRSLSSCETGSSAQPQAQATAAIDNEQGNGSVESGTQTEVVCDATDVETALAASPAELAGEEASTTSETSAAEADHADTDHTVAVPAEATSTVAPPATTTPDDSDPVDPAPGASDPTPAEPDSAAPVQPNPDPTPGSYDDITAFGVFHGTSSHTHGDSLAGGRTPITTEALVVYNDLRAFVGLDVVELEAIGRWAFANDLTNNGEAYEQDLRGVGLYYGMQGAKVGWIRDDAFDPQILADVQRAARQGDTSAVMTMVEAFGHPGYAGHLTQSDLVGAFVNTLKMEPHYGGWMHGRVHGRLSFSDGTGASVASSHDLNHLTVLSHDQTEPFMNDTFDWPQWPALNVPGPDVIDYFQSMVVLSDPRGDTQL